jgi:hypothetical protein
VDRGQTMQRQGRVSQAEYAGKKKETRRDKFLAEIEQVVPWERLVRRLRPFYPKGSAAAAADVSTPDRWGRPRTGRHPAS